MAYTRMTHTHLGKQAINYALSGKPHNEDKYVSGRVMSARGLNCTVLDCGKQMASVWSKYGISAEQIKAQHAKKPRRQVQRLIISFDPQQLSYKNKDDVRTAQKIGLRLAKRLYPNHQSIIVVQADNTHHVLHDHIITNMLDYRTGRAMHGRETDWRYVRPIADDVVRGFHNARGIQLDPLAHKNMAQTENGREPSSRIHRSSAEYHIKKRKGYSWTDDIRQRLTKAKKNATSWGEFIGLAGRFGIVVKPFRHKSGKIRRDSNGQPILKKRTSYSFKTKQGKKRRIRSSKLGTNFSPTAMSKHFAKNAQIVQERKQRLAARIKHEKAIEAQRKHDEAIKAKRRHEEAVKAEQQKKHEEAIEKQKQAERARMPNASKIEADYPVEPVMAKMGRGRSAMIDEIPLLPKMTDPKTAEEAHHKADVIDGKYHIVHDKPIKQSWFSSVLQAIHGRIATAERVAKDYAQRAKHWINVKARKLILRGIHRFRKYMDKIHGHKRINHTEHKGITYQQFNKELNGISNSSNPNANRFMALERKYPKYAEIHRKKINHALNHRQFQQPKPRWHGPTQQGPEL